MQRMPLEILFGYFKQVRRIRNTGQTSNNLLGSGHQQRPQQVFGHTSFVFTMQEQ